jgi:glycosyltransferase involved in cell wall biosynthesis
MNHPEVAIMIPVYNGIQTIQRAINSLLIQTFDNWVAVIVNDGSIDGTKEFLISLEDKRFIVQHFNENEGRPAARNAALRICKKYEFIAFLDADDIYHPEKLRHQIEFLRENTDVHLVSCGMGSFGEAKGLLRVRGTKSFENKSYNYFNELIAPRAACMIRSGSLGLLEFNSRLKMAQDSDFFMRYADGKKYGIIGEVLYYYSEFDSVTKNKIFFKH